MTFDVSLLALGSVFKKVKRVKFIFILSPIMYIIAMAPQNVLEISKFGEWIKRESFKRSN